MKNKKLFINIGQAFLANSIGRPLSKDELNKSKILSHCYIYTEDGIILHIGENNSYEKYISGDVEIIDIGGKVLTPGLIDAHTHFVFGGSREHEFALKLNGIEYLDILKMGGGILNTYKATNEIGFDDLYDKSKQILDHMLSYGVTTVEGKSGYGLNFNSEVKQLEIMKKLNENHPVDVVSTFMAAHACPPEYKNDKDAYIDIIINEMIPYVAHKKLAKFQDVFLETGVFDGKQAYKVLEAGNKYNLRARVHADEVDSIGGIDCAIKAGAISCEHLMATTDEDMIKMAESGIIANLLPATTFSLMKENFARARDFINKGVPITICSDFNPGSSPSENLQIAMMMAVYKMKLTPIEVLNAVTINAAYSLDLQGSIGSIEIGKKADFAIFDVPNIDFIFYNFGVNNVTEVYKNAKLVYKNKGEQNARIQI